MTRIDTREVRSLPAPADADPSPARGVRRFDYAVLLAARRTVVRPMSGAQPTLCPSDSRSTESDPPSAKPEDYRLISNERDTPSPDAGPTPAELAECRAISTRISNTATPIAAAALREQRDHLSLLGALSRDITAFCGNAAVAAGGPWEAHIVLSERILASTELHMTLSHFDLQLRFDTQDCDARQLLLTHSTALERDLDSILRVWGQSKVVRITVW
ncbi:type III secretion system protein SctP [Burkholderia alba]|uniref:type III secretion system protein SctP n=1 Tax=Burkholderia alba TaxID=2683677 RepID=UPI002B05C069|nr:type III secretion system protein SctP [Burkholderia alba]